MDRTRGTPSAGTTVVTADLSESVRAAQAGDENAFRLIYRAVQPGLLRYLTALVGADAEDVASETWLQIARDLRSFDGGQGFRAWAVTIARNRAMDHLRYRRRRPATSVPVDALAELPARDDTAERAGEGIATASALALIATLPKTEAEAVLLRSVVGLDAESVARVLGKRPGAVRVAAHRGLRRLARMLEHDDPLGSDRTTPGRADPARTGPDSAPPGLAAEPPPGQPRTSQ
ncbi:RNA polymerase sigma factor [Micromonospora zhanjiangensis]|uniref:RNA polymerase sigma factor n=1 Tax=Micromonospora zhanjiangensis TaxID=1522057 RepID=A0ABV8KXG8_9ACTN